MSSTCSSFKSMISINLYLLTNPDLSPWHRNTQSLPPLGKVTERSEVGRGPLPMAFRVHRNKGARWQAWGPLPPSSRAPSPEGKAWGRQPLFLIPNPYSLIPTAYCLLPLLTASADSWSQTPPACRPSRRSRRRPRSRCGGPSPWYRAGTHRSESGCPIRSSSIRP